MDVKKYQINISSEENDSLEYLYILSQGLNELLNILMMKENISFEFLNKKLEEKKEILIQLEKEKRKIELKYLPAELINKKYNLFFDFSESTIEYIV